MHALTHDATGRHSRDSLTSSEVQHLGTETARQEIPAGPYASLTIQPIPNDLRGDGPGLVLFEAV